MCFRSQIDGMSTMTEIHQSRLQDLVYLHESERENLLEESEKERKKMDNNQEKTEYYLDDVVIALDQRHAVMEQEIKNEYQAVREDVKNKVTKKAKLTNIDVVKCNEKLTFIVSF